MTDGIVGKVTGTVGRTGTAKNGPYAVLEVQRQGATYPDRVTAWGLDATTGDLVTVTGFLSWRKSERDGKTYFDVSLNQPKLESQVTAPAAVNVDDSTPF
jgi:hypothetical protein